MNRDSTSFVNPLISQKPIPGNSRIDDWEKARSVRIAQE